MDDALCMIFLFARLPINTNDSFSNHPGIPLSSTSGAFSHLSEENCAEVCSKLADEFMLYVIESHSLRKCFISIKGIYYQAEINGTPVTWVVPHHFPQEVAADVDFRVMHTFLEFYATLLGFVNFRLYKTLGVIYPPEVDLSLKDIHEESSLSYLQPKRIDDLCIPVELDKANLLFEGKVFFISREVHKTPFELIIRSMGGTVGWEGAGSAFSISDESIHYQVIDRPTLPDSIHIGRGYVQPQFVFDCVNAGTLLDAKIYAPGQKLPPHLSPFVVEENDSEPEEEEEEVEALEKGVGERPTNKEVLEELNQLSSDEEEDEKSDDVEIAERTHKSEPKLKAKLEKERKEMAVSMLPRKQRTMYNEMKGKKNEKKKN